MSGLIRKGFLLSKNAILSTSVRSISTTSTLNLKEIREKKEGTTLVIDAVKLPSPRAELLVKAENVKDIDSSVHEHEGPVCYMCALGLEVKHTDVMILSQFVRSDGCMLPRRITGLCKRQQKKIGTMVTMAQKAGLMINLTPGNCKKDPTKRKDYKKYNTYYDEKTIFMRKQPAHNDKFKLLSQRPFRK